MTVSVLIPAHNEAAYLPRCLDAICASDPCEGKVEVIVMANGCSDETAALARSYQSACRDRNWDLHVLDIAEGGKLNVLNQGDQIATGDVLIYVDADVVVAPQLMGQLASALDGDVARYGSGTPCVTTQAKGISAAFTRFWLTTPFMTQGVSGFGVFAMNRAGRNRWGAWPRIISDDTFARLHFAPEERVSVPASFDWPMIEGFAPLVKVRRRQDEGVAEIMQRFPQLFENEDDYADTSSLLY